MKCKSVACIWSDSPPVQRVTAVASLDEPPTLYTGGSDGSIIWWNLISSSEKSEIKPVAMLCGHASSISDLEICFPHEGSEIGRPNNSSDASCPSSTGGGALISACIDGVLCVWSRVSGHCRRRRKIPPWAGSPFVVRMVPGNRRYVCVMCCFFRQANESLNSTEGGEDLGDNEGTKSGPSNCTIVIVDSSTLGIVQTVLHGNVPIGPLKSMAVLPTDDMEKRSILVIDSFGKVVCLPTVKDFDSIGSNAPLVRKDSLNLEVIEWIDSSKEKEPLVAFAECSYVLALVYRTYCTFRRADNGIVLGEIPFSDELLSPDDNLFIIGGVFLEDYALTANDVLLIQFVAWNTRGKAIIYSVSYSSSTFKFDPLYIIPAELHSADMKPFFSLLPLDKHLLRVESVCFHVKGHVSWRPSVTIWLVPQKNDKFETLRLECVMLGQGNLFDNWAMCSSSTTEGQYSSPLEKDTAKLNKKIPFQNNKPSPPDQYGTYSSRFNNGASQGSQPVSSSMVISENYLAPYGIVYGLFNGDIEIIRFHIFTASNLLIGSSELDADSHGQKQYLSGHSGAVLCLASHQMVSRSGPGGCNSNHVLLSGSTDCTVRVWDLDSGHPIAVLHQHVAPVRQIVLPPSQTEHPWSDCFLTVGDDTCVALVSLHTLRVERLFPGHLHCPTKVVWDGVRGYVACLCPDHSGKDDILDILYIWDVKTGARERLLRGSAAHSMFDHFLKVLSENVTSSNLTCGNTSASSLRIPFAEATNSSQPQPNVSNNKIPFPTSNPSKAQPKSSEAFYAVKGQPHSSGSSNAVKGKDVKPGLSMSFVSKSGKHLITSACPFPGVCSLCFDLTSLMSLCSKNEAFDGDHIADNMNLKNNVKDDIHVRENAPLVEIGPNMPGPGQMDDESNPTSDGSAVAILKHREWICSLEGRLIQFSLSFLHLWDVDIDLDDLLITEMKLERPDSFIVSTGMLGDRGSMTLTFPGSDSKLELWRSSAEYSALRSLTIVSLAQHLISLSHSCSSSSSALAAFYTRKFAEKYPDLKPPLLQLLVSFWQNEFEHVKMAARSLFHCATSRAIPLSLCRLKSSQHETNIFGRPEKKRPADALRSVPDENVDAQRDITQQESEIISWLESYEVQDWISCVGGTTQDAMTAQIIVAAALVVWYPTLVKPRLDAVVVHQLVKLVMAMNEKYSVAAAEILAEGMEGTWKACINSQIPHLIGDIFFQVECVSSSSANGSAQTSPSLSIRETLVGVLLPNLAMADITGFLHVIERQIWSTASDSPVHVVALMTLIRVVRGSPRNLAPYLDKVVSFILQTMDPGNSTMRRNCLQISLTALREVVRVFPMVAVNDTPTRLAVGDAIAEIKNASIRVYDMQSMSKIKVLDASGPPGLPSLVGEKSEMAMGTAISAISFSPDGEGLVAFSENGLMIRWWSLGSAWWEKLNRTLIPVQCTKLILVPPWDGFSPNSARSSIMASVSYEDGQATSQESSKSSGEIDRLKLLIHNLDMSYRLEWVGERKLKLTHQSHELSTFLL